MSAKPNEQRVAVVQSNDAENDREYGSVEEVFDHMEQGVVVWSRDLVCEFVNKRYYELVDLTENELRPGIEIQAYYDGLEALDRISEEDAQLAVTNFRQRKAFSFERKLPSGATLAFVGRPLHTGGLVVTLTDITGLRQHEEKLNSIVARAEDAEMKMGAALAIEQKHRDEADMLSEFGDWIHSCESLEEVFRVVSQSLAKAYEGTSGELYIYRNSRDGLELGTKWGDGEPVARMHQKECWALRRGRGNAFGEGFINLACQHVHGNTSEEDPTHYLCLPIIAHGDTVGLLHIDLSARAEVSPSEVQFTTDFMNLITRYAEHISLAVANVKLRHELHLQSTLDSLTGMYNRRCFLDLAATVLSDHEATNLTAAVAVFDVDNFKLFNDQFGHDAGDRILIELARVTKSFFNEDVLISRMGGEEFAILLPDVSLKQARNTMVKFAETLNAQSILYGNSSLPPCSISVGVSMYPASGDTLHELICLADSAMYRAKRSGKNCVCVAKGSTEHAKRT